MITSLCWSCHISPSLASRSPLSHPVSLPEPVPGPEPFRKKEVVEILSHKKAYNTCEKPKGPIPWVTEAETRKGVG